jgi:2-polyprenyl-6-methoxyphenol hydroxylase-like FAD-dependent oxidoreductase
MDVDIVIIGGGLAGATLAAALADGGHRMALVERKAPPAPPAEWDSRVYTLTPASIAFLERAGAWQHVPRDRVAPIYDMQVFGDDGESRLAPALRSGRCSSERQRSGRLHQSCGGTRASEISLDLSAVPSGTPCRRRRRVGLGPAQSGRNGGRRRWRKLWVRQGAGIRCDAGYDRLVSSPTSVIAHRDIAYQWFRGDGVLAFLPLPGRRVSIVWSTSRAYANELLALSPTAFCARVSEASRGVLGDLQLLTPPAAFPLSRMVSRRIALERVALIGDSAHVVHPLAGQGINLGLGDAHCLADLLRQATDPGDRALLRRFERSRAEDILALHWVTHGLFRLFGTNHAAIRRIRNLGLNLTNATPVIKTLLTRRATAVGGGLHQGKTS